MDNERDKCCEQYPMLPVGFEGDSGTALNVVSVDVCGSCLWTAGDDGALVDVITMVAVTDENPCRGDARGDKAW